MAQFQIPQFIETEPKIVGPLTLRQFIYIGVAGLLIFMLFFVLKTFFWFIAAAFIGAITLAFAFGKYNGQRLTVVFKNALFYLWQPKLYLWQRKSIGAQLPTLPKMLPTPSETPGSKIRNLWLNLTTKRPSGPPSR